MRDGAPDIEGASLGCSDIVEGRKTEGAQLYIEHFSEDYNADPVTRAERDRELRREFESRQKQ